MSLVPACTEVSSSMTTSCTSPTATEQYLDTSWGPVALIDQNVGLDVYSGSVSNNITAPQIQGNNSSDAGVIGQDPMPLCFSNGSFPEIMSSFVLSKQDQNIGALASPRLSLKRKRMPASGALCSHTPPDGIQKDVSPESVKSPMGNSERNKKGQLNPDVNTCKQNTNPAKENSQKDDTPNEEYIHVRAKRGQATNSHSLAERVRRERISERMRLLQGLVPGCNKIMGKAVMLDEIINYVQAMQRQVEFLSMKLATVSPELKLDLEQILSKDIFHLKQADSTILGYGPGISTPHPYLHGSTTLGFMQTELPTCDVPNFGDMLRVSIHQISPFAQISIARNADLQNVVQMDFTPDLPLSYLSRSEL